VLKPRALLILVVALGLSACGSEPAQVPDIKKTPKPARFVPFIEPGGDVRFDFPKNWALIMRSPPGVATVASGGAAATVWAYRTVAVVTDAASAKRALARLVASLKRRDRNFRIVTAELTTVLDAPAVEIDGTTEIAGREVRVRSVHVYFGLGEYVFDAFADPGVFARANEEVFGPMLASLRLEGNPMAAAGVQSAPGAAGATPAPAVPEPAPGG
jgi:hypothetical protein